MDAPTVVLVHGAWHGSWCWQNVIDGLAEKDVDAIAVDLPGHDAPGSSKRTWNRLSSYVDLVHSVIDGIDGEVVLVGHSMGGLVTQRVLETRSAAAAMLVASIPLSGATGVAARLLRHHPEQFLSTFALSLWGLVGNDERVREHFFTDSTDEAVVSSTGTKLQNESYLAFLSMLLRWPKPARVMRGSTPISVVAAKHDNIFTLQEQRKLAAAYNTSATVIDCGHDIMLEAQYPELVDLIAESASVNA